MSGNHGVIDLRSDTVTRPTPEMRRAMASARVGDDVYQEDPTVNRLEALAAERMGTEAALFVPSGTQSNLLALLTHCERGDEYIAGKEAHIYKYEGGGGASMGGIQAQTLPLAEDGSLELASVRAAVRPDDVHFPRTRLLCLENTIAGRVLPPSYLQEAENLAREHGLALHLDGARIFNAAVKLGMPVTEISRHFDSVSFCLSKGLGAPVGSLLCGSRPFTDRARRWRKVLGGGMRQSGVLAAAGIVALESHVERLRDDHENALALGRGLAEIGELGLDPDVIQTNMVFLSLDPDTAADLGAYLRQRGIFISGRDSIRLVTHLDITRADIERVILSVQTFFDAGS